MPSEDHYDADKLLRLISLLYDTVGAPDRWEDLLQELVPITGSDNAALHHYSKHNARQSLDVSHNLDPDTQAVFDHYYSRINPWIVEGLPKGFYAPGNIVLSHEIVPDRAFERTEFCADFARPNDTYYSLGMTIAENRRYMALFSLQRARRGGAYRDADRRLFQQLVPHFQRVLELHDLVAEHHRTQQALTATLDRLPMGVVLVTRNARVKLANCAAQQLLSAQDGLQYSNGRLATESTDITHILERMIADAAATSAGDGNSAGGGLALPRSNGARDLSALVTPLPQDDLLSVGRAPLAGVFLSDPERPATGFQQTMQELYELTPAEARLAGVLMEGHDLRSATAELNIAYETARNHLKRVLAKTGAGHQGELIRVLLSGPAVVS